MFDRQTVLTMSGKYFEIFIGVGGLVLIIIFLFYIFNIHITELESHTSVGLENENTK